LIKSYEKKLSRFDLKLPKTTSDKTKSKLKMCDDYTKNVIIDYLHLDNFELVKNIA
jgi:hypothetical protein